MAFFVPLAICLPVSYIIVTAIYNLYFHPLSKVPGPFLCRISGFPSFYHACRYQRHIWIWQQFQIYGDVFRATPNLILFRDPNAYNCIYNSKANVRKADFYAAWRKNGKDRNTLSETDVGEHARRRRLLNLAFSEKSLKASEAFHSRHIDRWHELLMPNITDEEKRLNEDGWGLNLDLAESMELLVFDILGDLSFGVDFQTKEPGENKLKEIPKTIRDYMMLFYPITKSAFLSIILWLKPRGFDKLMELATPAHVKDYYAFLESTLAKRVEFERQREKQNAPGERLDMFHFLCTARDPETGELAMPWDTLLSDANLLIIAGSHTTTAITTSLFFYITHNPRVYNKLVAEIRSTFNSAEEIIHGPKLTSCKYLRAVIDETLRFTAGSPEELPRIILKPGLTINGQFYPEGTEVGCPAWSMNRNENIYNDSHTFRPERWIVSEHPDSYNTTEDVARTKNLLHTFLKGPGTCPGQNMAYLLISMIVARTLWRSDVRLAPGVTKGEGSEELGWGRRDKRQHMLIDSYVTMLEGPVLQFRKKVG